MWALRAVRLYIYTYININVAGRCGPSESSGSSAASAACATSSRPSWQPLYRSKLPPFAILKHLYVHIRFTFCVYVVAPSRLQPSRLSYPPQSHSIPYYIVTSTCHSPLSTHPQPVNPAYPTHQPPITAVMPFGQKHGPNFPPFCHHVLNGLEVGNGFVLSGRVGGAEGRIDGTVKWYVME